MSQESDWFRADEEANSRLIAAAPEPLEACYKQHLALTEAIAQLRRFAEAQATDQIQQHWDNESESALKGAHCAQVDAEIVIAKLKEAQ